MRSGALYSLGLAFVGVAAGVFSWIHGNTIGLVAAGIYVPIEIAVALRKEGVQVRDWWPAG